MGMFERLAIPTPFQIGAVNGYLTGRTLIDPGPDSDDAWDALRDALEARDLAVADLERVLITHPHPDHFGLAGRLREAGAAIVASAEAAAIIADFADRLTYEQEFLEPFLRRHGVAADVAGTVVRLPEAYLEFAPDCPVDRRLDDGERLELADAVLTTESVAGHAPGEVIYTAESPAGPVAVVGDHVLDPITPNPFLQPPPDRGAERPRVLPAYNRSLDRLAERDFHRLYPGHRDRIDRPTHRIEQLRRFHEHRTDSVEDLVAEPRDAAMVMRELFDDLPVTEVYSGMSEAIGHLDVLEQRGAVRREEREDRVQFVARDQ